jgi:DNA polymerase V
VEIYSIDEAFLTLAGFERRSLTDYARLIRATVRRDTGIPVSIGIGPTKTLAKIVNHLAKAQPESGGVSELSEADVDEALAWIEIREVWGIEPHGPAWLEEHGITTALDLKRADPKAIRRKMTLVGERLVHELNGRPCLPLELVTPPRQSLTVSRSFGQTLTALRPIKDAPVAFAGRAGEKLRRQGLMAGQVLVFVTTNGFSARQPFYANSATVRLPSPTDFTPDLVEAA